MLVRSEETQPWRAVEELESMVGPFFSQFIFFTFDLYPTIEPVAFINPHYKTTVNITPKARRVNAGQTRPRPFSPSPGSCAGEEATLGRAQQDYTPSNRIPIPHKPHQLRPFHNVSPRQEVPRQSRYVGEAAPALLPRARASAHFQENALKI